MPLCGSYLECILILSCLKYFIFLLMNLPKHILLPACLPFHKNTSFSRIIVLLMGVHLHKAALWSPPGFICGFVLIFYSYHPGPLCFLEYRSVLALQPYRWACVLPSKFFKMSFDHKFKSCPLMLRLIFSLLLTSHVISPTDPAIFNSIKSQYNIIGHTVRLI